MLIIAYLGAVIGAGFASGQEIVQFFVNYGAAGLKGGLIAGLLFAFSGGLLLYLAHARQISTYQELLRYLFGPFWGKTIDFLLAGFLFMGIGTMLSASGAIFYEHLYLPNKLGIALTYLIVIIFLITGKKGLVNSYNILVPLKVLLLLAITAYAAFGPGGNETSASTAVIGFAARGNWLAASLLYVAYNFALAMVVLTAYQSLTPRRPAVMGAVWGGLLLGLLVVVYYLAMIQYWPAISGYQIPMLYVTGRISLSVKTVYTLVLWVGILTTALASAYGFSQRITGLTGLNYRVCLLLGMTLALPVAMHSFSALVGKVYPLFGVLGIIIMSTLLYKSVKEVGLELYYNIIRIITKFREV